MCAKRSVAAEHCRRYRRGVRRARSQFAIRRDATPSVAYGLLAAALTVACGESSESERVASSVVVDASDIETVTTDLGYEVEVSLVRVALRDFAFQAPPEGAATSWLERARDFLVPVAHAHPGHNEGGQTTGELAGHFVIDFSDDDARIGTAEFIVGRYESVEFVFERASEDEVSASDPLLGHTFQVEGTATKGDFSLDFRFLVDAPVGRVLEDALAEFEIEAAEEPTLAFQFATSEPYEGTTLFDAIDFAMLEPDAASSGPSLGIGGSGGIASSEGLVVIDPETTGDAAITAYQHLLRALGTHHYYSVEKR